MKKLSRSILGIGLSVCLFGSSLTAVPAVKAEKQSANTITLGRGSYSAITKGKQVYSEQAGLVDRTTEQAWWPKRSVPRNVYVTENMKGAIPTNDWATSFLWGSMYGGVKNPYSEPAYAFPLAYKASSEGMYLTQPPVHMVKQSSGALDYAMPLQTGYVDFAVKPAGFTPSDAKVDKVTDWCYDIVMENGQQKMKTIMAQGSPYAFFECEQTDLEINFKRGTRMNLVQGNSDENVLVVKVLDNKENDWNYYAIYGPKGVKWDFAGNTKSIDKIKADLPDDRSYLSIAVLPDESTKYVSLYEKYAYNFINDTQAVWTYDDRNGNMTTCYLVKTDNKAESKAEGTLYGLLPHQWKNCPTTDDYLDAVYHTVRGTMKIKQIPECFETRLKYTGILPYMPKPEDKEEPQLREYLNDYMEQTKNNPTPYLFIGEGSGDTYWTGKGLNKLVNVLAVAEQLGETQKAATLLNALKGVLEDWFSTDDSEQDNYFYYDKEVGTLVGYPSSFGSDTQLNDHHFHYGYWIFAAAQVALRDPEWIKESQWGAMVKELVADIASTDRDNTRYPYLRNFAPYEGHSWASGPQLFTDGNNQESSSEAINAWAGMILLGETMDDRNLRDLGVYLYTTEVSAIENYWFDLDKDVLSPEFRYRDESATAYDKKREEVQCQASMVWGGKYVYGTWWTAEPLQVQGINLLPMTGASLYLAKNERYIKDNYWSARKLEAEYNGSDKLAIPIDRWNDIWNEYLALADPSLALQNWSARAAEENGETRAHTYQYMKSLERYGTPDLTVTSDCALSALFIKAGVKSYCAFNTSDEEKTVTFTDGGVINVAPHSMYAGASGTGNEGEVKVTSTPVVTSKEPEETASVPEPSEISKPLPSADPLHMAYFDENSWFELTDRANPPARIVFLKDVEWVDVHYYTGTDENKMQNYRMEKRGNEWYTDIPNLVNDFITASFTYFDKEKGYAVDTKPETVYWSVFNAEIYVFHVNEKPRRDEQGNLIEPEVSVEPEWVTVHKTKFDDHSYLYREDATHAKVVFLEDAEWVKVRLTYGVYRREETICMEKGEDYWYVPIEIEPPDQISVDFTYQDKVTGKVIHTDYATLNFYEDCVRPTALPKITGTPVQIPTSLRPTPSGQMPTVNPSPMQSPFESKEEYIRRCYKAEVSVDSNYSGCVQQKYSVTHKGSEPLELSKLTIRYYYDKNGSKQQNFWCDNAGLNLNSAPWYVDLSQYAKGTFHKDYMELSLDTEERYMPVGSKLDIGIRFAQSDWSPYEQFKENGLEIYYDGVLLEKRFPVK